MPPDKGASHTPAIAAVVVIIVAVHAPAAGAPIRGEPAAPKVLLDELGERERRIPDSRPKRPPGRGVRRLRQSAARRTDEAKAQHQHRFHEEYLRKMGGMSTRIENAPPERGFPSPPLPAKE
jgi:hypothetical protein